MFIIFVGFACTVQTADQDVCSSLVLGLHHVAAKNLREETGPDLTTWSTVETGHAPMRMRLYETQEILCAKPLSGEAIECIDSDFRIVGLCDEDWLSDG